MKQSLRVILACAFAAAPLAGCSGGAKQAPDSASTFTPALQIHTRIEAPGLKELSRSEVEVPQGHIAAVHCLVRRGSSWVETMPWNVVSEPALPVAQRTSVEVRLIAAAPGTYQVRCVAANGVQDGQGVTLKVLEGAPGQHGEEPNIPGGGLAEGEGGPSGGHGAGDGLSDGDDGDDDAGDGFSGGDEVPPGWALGQPYRWNARWDDAGQDLCYSEHRAFMLLRPAVYDAFGNLLPDAPIRILARDSAVNILENPPGVSFSRPGTYEVTAYVEGADSPRLQPVTHVFEVDSTPPKITILSPARGTMQATQDGAPVRVHAVIEDSSGLGHASFDGAPLAIAPGATRHEFIQDVKPRWGLNVFKVQATDQCEVSALHAQSFTHSQQFAAADAPANAVRARFGQKVLDDRGPDSPSTDASLAGLVQRALRHENFKDVFPEFLSASPAGPDGRLEETVDHCLGYTRSTRKSGYEIWRRGEFAYDSAQVTKLEAVPGQWQAEVTFKNLRLPVRVVRRSHIPCAGNVWRGQYDVNLDVETFMVAFKVEAASDGFSLHIPQESFDVRFDDQSPRVTFVNKDVLLSSLPDGMLTQLKNGVIRHVYLNVFRKNIGERLHKDLTEVLATFVAGLRMDRTVDMPLPWAHEQGKMSILTAVDHLEVGTQSSDGSHEGDRSGELGLQALIAPPPGTSTGLGAIRAPSEEPQLRLQGDQSASFAVYDDFVNQGLHALWQRDAFKVEDLPGALGFRSPQAEAGGRKAMDLRFEATTPPVLMPGEHDQEVIVGWGDAQVNARFNTALLSQKYKSAQPGIADGEHPDIEVDLYCSIQVRGTLKVDGATQTLSLDLADGTPQMDMQVVRMSNPVYQELASTQLEHFAKAVRPQLEVYLGEALPRLTQKALKGVPLPLFQFDGTPIRWRLENPEITRPAGAHHSVLRGRLAKDDQVPVD